MTLRPISDTTESKPKLRDLRTFEVRSRGTSDRLGTVHDVLVDERGETRYLCIEDGRRHVLLPADEAMTDRDHGIVWVAHGDVLRALPEWSHATAAVDGDFEQRVIAASETAYDGERWHERPEFRGGRWSAGTDRAASGRLDRLDFSEYRVASGEPDPRGWSVAGRDGRKLGHVETLIGDTGNLRVIYLAMRVDRDLDPSGGVVLIPVGMADLVPDRRQVHARGMDRACVHRLPRWSGITLTREDERAVVAACNRAYSGPLRYEHPRFRDDEEQPVW